MMRAHLQQATPKKSDAFATLSLRPELLASIATLAYEAMTPVQAQTLPINDASALLQRMADASRKPFVWFEGFGPASRSQCAVPSMSLPVSGTGRQVICPTNTPRPR